MKILLLSFLMLLANATMAAAPQTEEIKLPDGKTITNTVTTVDPSPQKIRVLNQQELNDIDANSRSALGFVQYYFPKIKKPNLKDYDHAYRAWQLSDERKFSETQVTQILGSFLGNKCVAELNMEWVEVTDQYGTDLAVRGRNVEVMSFPYAVVQKRIVNRQYDFMYNVFHTVKSLQRDNRYKAR